MPSLLKLKQSARSRIGELISLTPLPSAADGASFNPKTAVCSAKVKSTEDTKEHVSGEYGGTNRSLNFTLVLGAPPTSPFLLLSTKVAEKGAAREHRWRQTVNF